jgi:hypothetical protein
MKLSIRVIASGLCAAAILLSAVASAAAAEPFWRAEETQIPTGTTANSLRDVTCPEYYAETETFACFGVGSSTPSLGGSKPLIEVGGSGIIGPWELFPGTPSSSEYPGAVLEAISCPLETFCQAVGYYTPKAGVRRPLAERMNSSYEWKFEKPALAGTDEFTELNGVFCTSVSNCEAVGTTEATSTSTASKTLAEKWNGATWSVQTSFSTTGVLNKLADVSCTALNSCMAVGNNGSAALSETYSGTEWKQVVTGATGTLEGVSCSASSACTAVGVTSGKIIARRWNGTAWAAQSPVVPVGSTASTGADVNCLTATECVAVGSYTSAGTSHALAEHWNGTTWSQDSVPAAKGSSSETLLGVTCRAAILCSAVGSGTFSGVVKPLAEVYR